MRTRLGYELICRFALALLDHHVRGEPSEPAALSELAPEGFVEVIRHLPKG